MNDYLLDIIDEIKYGIFKTPHPSFGLPNHISLNVRYDKKNSIFWAEAKKLPGFIVSSEKKEDLLRETYETLLVYFDVPRYFAKKMNPQGQMILSDGTKVRLTSVSLKEDLNYAKT